MVGFRAAVPTAASALGFLDTGATVVMVPTIARDLHASAGDTQGVLSLVLLIVGLLVVPAGALVDRLGPARIGRIGLVLAAAACVLTAYAPDVTWLLAARAAFGLGAGLFLPAALAEAGNSRLGQRMLVRWTVAVSVVTLIAPAVGAFAVAGLSWRGLYLLEAGLALVFAVTWQRSAARIRREAGAPGPGRSSFLSVQAVTATAYAAFAALPLLLSVYLQDIAGLSPFAVGALLCIDGVLVVLLTPVLGRTGDDARAGMRRLAAGSLVCATSAVPLLFASGEGWGIVAVVAGLAVLGVGSAMFITPLTTLALKALGDRHSGKAAGVNLAIARLAAAGGVAATGVIAAPVFTADLGAAGPAFRTGLIVVLIMFAAAAAVAGARLLAGRRATTRPVREDQHHPGRESEAYHASQVVGA